MAETKEKKYICDDAQLMSEWDWEKNTQLQLDPHIITIGSRRQVWWICSAGHNYDARVSNKAILRRGCPICSGKRAAVGINDLETRFPEIALEWDYTKNGELKPTDVVAHSNKKVWWKCSKCGNSWQQNCNLRTARKTGCPYCSGRVAFPGVNDLATVNPELAKQWHPTKNIKLNPSHFLPQSNQKIWWVCDKGHEWVAAVADRYQGTGCPICAGKQILVGFNDLQTTHPELAKEWNSKKNGELHPTSVSSGTNRKVWWICDQGHEWKSAISNRSRGDHNCPICGNQQLLQGYNDLATTNPLLTKEWHPNKNGELSPRDVFQNTNKKVWWQCRKGHEWQASPNERSQGNGCPTCSSELHTSFPEQCLLFYFSKITTALSRQKIDGIEIDVFLPQINVGIEYNGRYYHKNVINLKKISTLQQKGIRVITVHESDKNDISGDVVYYVYNFRDKSNLQWAMKAVFSLVCLTPPVIDITQDELAIYEQYIQLEKENSIAAKNPEIAKEWHPSRNGKLTADMVSYQSNIKVWWLGNCGHEWQASTSHRYSGRGCPYCCNNAVLPGFNDLSTTNPDLSIEWNYSKNKELSPEDVTQGCSKKVWWICAKGHEWEATVYSRNGGTGCPYCSGRLVLPGENDFLTVYPNIATEWHPTKNNGLLPSQITSRNSKKVWWQCSTCGHEWETRVVHRANGHGCPICARKNRK